MEEAVLSERRVWKKQYSQIGDHGRSSTDECQFRACIKHIRIYPICEADVLSASSILQSTLIVGRCSECKPSLASEYTYHSLTSEEGKEKREKGSSISIQWPDDYQMAKLALCRGVFVHVKLCWLGN